MQENQYKNTYQQLQIIGNYPTDEFKLYLVREYATGNYRTAKKMSIFQTSDTFQDQTLNEVRILKDLNNPHVIKYYDVMLENQQFITILEFCEEGDLEHYLKRRKDRKQLLSEKLILSWLMQLLMALQYIHSKNIIHRLVSSKNVYLNHQGDLKLGSFGRARTLQSTLEKAMTVVGSPCNLSPEAVEGHPYDSKLDIWALGCLIYELATFNHPYKIKNLPQLYEMIVKNPPLQLPIKYSKYLSPIYKKMMKKNPNLRPSAKELLEESIFIQLMKQYTKKKKIDALDLREITPKQLAIHRKKKQLKEKKSQNKFTLPPLSPSPNNTSRKQPRQPVGRSQRNQNNRDKSRGKSREKVSKKESKEKNKGETKHEQRAAKCTPKKEEEQKMKSPKIVSPKQQERSLSDSNVSNSERITPPKLDQVQYISILYQLKLQLLQKKYSPLMSQIFQQTVEFEEYQ